MDKQFVSTHRKSIIIFSLVAFAILVAITTAVFIINTNKQTSEGNSFAYLPARTCPDRQFVENGMQRADYHGKPYLISSEDQAWISQNCKQSENTGNTPVANNPAPQNQPTSPVQETEPPLLLKSVGFDLGYYNASTGRAGDIKFTKIPLMFNQIVSPFGQQDPRTTDTSKTNPQPTFILPLGTKVKALVDGIVVDVKTLYSGDSSVMVAKSNESQWIYETEHVMNVSVKKGDKVTAGQIIAEVSNYDTKNTPGFGLVEIGILHASTGLPEHVCPFQYLDPAIRDDINAKLSKLYSDWEAYTGKDVYKQEKFVSPGCVVYTPAKG